VPWPSASWPATRSAGSAELATGRAAATRTGDALARLYDLDLLEEPGDLDLYLGLAERADGPILELAAGTGRLAVPLAATGRRTVAVDLDPAMLTRARARAAAGGRRVSRALTLVEADLVGLRLPDAGAYRLAILALNSLFVLATRAAQRAAFETLAAHLGSGGLAAIDCWLPDVDDLARYDGRLLLEWVRTDPETGSRVVKTGSALYDATTRTVSLTTIFEEAAQGASPARWIREDRLRLVNADELVEFAEAAGLEVEALGGGYDLEPIGPGSERAVLVARRR
jgi:SAM-dependent methyltransferase